MPTVARSSALSRVVAGERKETQTQANSWVMDGASRVTVGWEARLGNARGSGSRCQAVNTPGAGPAGPRASGSCGAPQLLQEAQGRQGTEARLEIAHHLPLPERESRRGSEAGQFGIPKPVRDLL